MSENKKSAKDLLLDRLRVFIENNKATYAWVDDNGFVCVYTQDEEGNLQKRPLLKEEEKNGKLVDMRDFCVMTYINLDKFGLRDLVSTLPGIIEAKRTIIAYKRKTEYDYWKVTKNAAAKVENQRGLRR